MNSSESFTKLLSRVKARGETAHESHAAVSTFFLLQDEEIFLDRRGDVPKCFEGIRNGEGEAGACELVVQMAGLRYEDVRIALRKVGIERCVQV